MRLWSCKSCISGLIWSWSRLLDCSHLYTMSIFFLVLINLYLVICQHHRWCSRSITLAARSAENRIQSVCLDLQVSASGGTDVSHWTVLTGVWISQSWSPPFCRAGRPCSTTLQDNKIWPEKFCCCRSNFVELSPIVSSRPITNTMSVLCTFENSFIPQSIWNTSLAPPWQLRL